VNEEYAIYIAKIYCDKKEVRLKEKLFKLFRFSAT